MGTSERHVLADAERASERRLIIDGAGREAGGMWPHFPILPVKRGDGIDTEAGIIVWRYLPPADGDRPVRVYLANLFELGEKAAEVKRRDDKANVSYAEVLDGVETVDYQTLDAFFDDGWMAD